MRTCLSILWDALINHVIEIKHISFIKKPNDNELAVFKKCRENMCRTIENFYDGLEDTRPEHIGVFYKVLSCSDSNIFQAAEEAVKCSSKCHLCVGCTECAKKFYDLILSKEKQERELPIDLQDYFGSESQFYYYLSAYNNVKEYRKIKDTLICLKGFSSTTPAIYSAAFEDTCTGGGLYLNVGGYGIVIDPGIGFVDSMHRQGIFIEDINTVIVTHNHLDHMADLGTLSALLHDINRYYEKQVSFYKNFFKDTKSKSHSINWILDKGTKDSTSEVIKCSEELVESSKWKELNGNISIATIKTEHMQEGVSYGIKFKILLDDNEIQVGYTSDTKFFHELADFFKNADILIFNISDIYEKDVRGTKGKSGHLGFDGSIKLLMRNSRHSQLAIASEFCCSNGDCRMRVTKSLTEQVGKWKNVNVIPGEVGLKVDLASGGICCSRCKNIVSVDSISIVAPEKEFGRIQYICNKCQYTMKKD